MPKKSKKREERERVLQEARRKRNKRLAIVAACVAALVAVAVLAPRIAPDYVSCFPNSHQNAAQHFHPWVYVQIGEGPPDSQSIRVPDNMGIGGGCMWPIHVHEGEGARGFYFTMLHVESPHPRSEHAFTLGDLFDNWGEWQYGQPIYFDHDGVSSYRGHVEVRTARNVDIFDTNGPWDDAYGWSSQPASRGIALEDGVFTHIWVHTNP